MNLRTNSLTNQLSCLDNRTDADQLCRPNVNLLASRLTNWCDLASLGPHTDYVTHLHSSLYRIEQALPVHTALWIFLNLVGNQQVAGDAAALHRQKWQ